MSAAESFAVDDARAVAWIDDPVSAVDRDAIVLIPSLGTSSMLFDELLASLRRAGSTLVPLRVDIPGHGRGPLRSRLSIQEVAAAVAGGVERSKASSVVVAGASLGGAVALEVARLLPARLRGFSMINSGTRFGSSSGWASLIDSVERHGIPSLKVGSARGWFSDDYSTTAPARRLLDDMATIDPATYVACCGALDAYDGREGVGDIVTPGMLIGTADDDATPADGLRELARLLPRGAYRELPTGRHLSLVEHSDAVAGLLIGWTGSLG